MVSVGVVSRHRVWFAVESLLGGFLVQSAGQHWSRCRRSAIGGRPLILRAAPCGTREMEIGAFGAPLICGRGGGDERKGGRPALRATGRPVHQEGVTTNREPTGCRCRGSGRRRSPALGSGRGFPAAMGEDRHELGAVLAEQVQEPMTGKGAASSSQ
jgi:hypothetical protein